MKGDCFLVAANLAADLSRVVPVALCHGMALGTGGEALGLRYGHAWVEIGDLVLDFSNGNSAAVPVEIYYALGKIRNVRRYTVDEMREQMFVTGHYGPWEE